MLFSRVRLVGIHVFFRVLDAQHVPPELALEDVRLPLQLPLPPLLLLPLPVQELGGLHAPLRRQDHLGEQAVQLALEAEGKELNAV